jgi:ATP-dependent 26S proteasome regulatory subunit
VRELLKPEFISFLLKNRNSVLVIEDAEKVVSSREYSNEGSVVSTILQLTDGLFSDCLNIKIICTFNSSMEKIDRALLRKGRMIAQYEFKPLCREKAARLSQSLGMGETEEDMTLADIFRQKEKGFRQAPPKQIGFSLKG